MKDTMLKKLQEESRIRNKGSWPPPVPPKGKPYSDAAIERRVYLGAKKVLDRVKSRAVSSMTTEAWGKDRKDKIVSYLTGHGLKCEILKFENNTFIIKVTR